MMNPKSIRPLLWPVARPVLVSVFFCSATAFVNAPAFAQTEVGPATLTSAASKNFEEDIVSLDLPESPRASAASAVSASDSSSAGEELLLPAAPGKPSQTSSAQGSSLPEAPRSQRYPSPGQTAPVLTAGDKVRMGFTGAFSYTTIIGWIASAGYEQATNGSPNFGTDRGAFGQRLWASAARATSENLLADSVFAPMLHEDPRYYRLGSTHKFLPRLVYSATRSIITRSDSGATVPNLSQIFGNAGGAALTYAYYPDSNRTAKQTAETFGGSLGGTALGDVIAEFFGRILYRNQP